MLADPQHDGVIAGADAVVRRLIGAELVGGDGGGAGHMQVAR